MKTLLINPPWVRLFGFPVFTFPSGLCYIAAVLEDNGFDVSVYDMDNVKGRVKPILSSANSLDDRVYKEYLNVLDDFDHPLWKEVRAVISKQSPDIIGITAMATQYGPGQNIAKVAKEFDSDISVVMGGPHPTAMPEETLKNENIDIVVRREGEYTFLDLVKSLESKGNLRDVLGITYKEKDKVINNPDRPLIENLDDIPLPARHLVLRKEDYPPGAFGKIFASRGCPYNCIFCAPKKTWGKKVRYRSPQKVVDEIRHVYETYVTPMFTFNDSDFLVNKKFVSEICDLLIEEGPVINWDCSAKASEITDDLIKKMALSGCQSISVGVESGSDETLGKAKKGVTTEQIKKSRKILKDNFMVYCAYYMVGFPWETREDIYEMLSFIGDMDFDFEKVFVVATYPGTELYEMYKDEAKDLDWRYYLIQRPEYCANKNLSKKDFSKIIDTAEKGFKRGLTLKTKGMAFKFNSPR